MIYSISISKEFIIILSPLVHLLFLTLVLRVSGYHEQMLGTMLGHVHFFTNLQAHRLMLASVSPVFERMFYGSTHEALTGTVVLHDCDPIAINWILENVYLGRSDIPNVVTGIMIYSVAQMYQMIGISNMCKNVSSLGS